MCLEAERDDKPSLQLAEWSLGESIHSTEPGNGHVHRVLPTSLFGLTHCFLFRPDEVCSGDRAAGLDESLLGDLCLTRT